MGLIDYAKRELALIGGEDDEMQSLMNKCILDVVTMFEEQGHSGSSAAYAINALDRLLRFKPLTPLTGEDDEWTNVTQKLDQNKRCFSVFREKGDNSTATYGDAEIFSDDGGKTWFTNSKSTHAISFPFKVPPEPVRTLIEKEAQP